jgi:hypothetical protein
MTTVVLNTTTKTVEVFSSARDVQARTEIADHKAAADPHPQYLAEAEAADIATSGSAADLITGIVPDGRMPGWTGYTAASKAALEAANVPTAVGALQLLGYSSPGDGGEAIYMRVVSEPSHPGKIQSADGAWWELAEHEITPQMLGAKGDGVTGDSTAIRRALLAAEALAAIVRVPPATYIIDSQISGVDNVRLVGNGPSPAVFKAANGLNANIFHVQSKDSFSIEGITFDGNSANQTAGSALIFQSVTNFSITGCRLIDIFWNGIALDDDCRDFDVSHNLIDIVGNHGISLSGDGTDAAGVRCIGGTISHNIIHNAGASGINISESSRITVVGNYIYHDGVPAHSSGAAGVRVTNRASDVSVVGNTVLGMSRGVFCIESQRVSIVGNVLIECGLQGILVADDSEVSFLQSEDTVVSGNVVYHPGQLALAGSQAGIHVRGSARTIITGNQITGDGVNMTQGIVESNSAENDNVDLLTLGNAISGNTANAWSLLSAPLIDEVAYFDRATNADRFLVLRSSAGGLPYFGVEGASTNIPVSLTAKGTTTARLGNATGTHFYAGGPATPDNYLVAEGQAASGGTPFIRAAGVDTNIDLRLLPKGTGRVRFGAHSAIGSETVSGYIEIKDNGGTVRKIAVVS